MARTHAREVVETYKEAQKKGITVVIVREHTVDITIYHRKKGILDRFQEINDSEKKKKSLTEEAREELKKLFQELMQQMGLE